MELRVKRSEREPAKEPGFAEEARRKSAGKTTDQAVTGTSGVTGGSGGEPTPMVRRFSSEPAAT
jgi:hypothetical protein